MDLNWQPGQEAADEAAACVTGLFSGADGDVEEVECEFYGQTALTLNTLTSAFQGNLWIPETG